MSKEVFTYKQVPYDAIECHWMLNDNIMGNGGDDEKLPGWQKNADIYLVCEVFINARAIDSCIRHDCGASFFVMYHSISNRGGTSVHGLVCKQKYNGSEASRIVLEGLVKGTEIAGTVTFTLMLCIDEHKGNFDKDASFDETIMAKEYGQIIYRTSKNIILEGRQTYFPVADIDFSKKGYNSSAFYFLQKSANSTLDSDFFAAYCLYFNNKHPLFNRINEDAPEESHVFSMILYDVYRQLIMDALDVFGKKDSPTMEGERKKGDHTVRAVYITLLEDLKKQFGGNSVEQIAEMAKDRHSESYSKFICGLQADLLDFE